MPALNSLNDQAKMTIRDTRSPSSLRLPVPPIPRPGDRVTWYTDARRVVGVYLGHSIAGRPVVESSFGNRSVLTSFDVLRHDDLAVRRRPCWEYLPPGGKIVVPTAHEAGRVEELLAQRIPPGPKYADFLIENWSRGFEIFAVGGTVRDIVAGMPSNDVDIVTTMPLTRAMPLLRAMYRGNPSLCRRNGFVRLGGTPASGDGFIDVKMFVEHDPGTPNVVFGASFANDIAYRDFTCNAVYYDPVNKVFIDPSGTGLVDAEARVLRLVGDPARRSPFQDAQVSVRFFKFLAKGFTATAETREAIRTRCLPSLPAMDRNNRAIYFNAQVLSKRRKEERSSAVTEYRDQMVAFGAEAEWAKFIEPVALELLL
jgi:hypothetical protein